MTDIKQQLSAAGLSPSEAEKKAALFHAVEQKLCVLAGKARVTSRRFVPGRIEVLGKHTDYAGGRSLLATVERGFCVVAAPRRDSMVRVVDAILGRVTEFEISPDLDISAAGWTVYPMTVARRVARNFGGELSGAEICFASDLPRSSGLSSSSALVVAVFLALSDINRLEQRPEYKLNIHGSTDLAGYLGSVENGQSFGALVGDRGVGTFGGSEDHTAMLCCRAGHVSQYAFCPVREEARIPLPPAWTFVVASSGIGATKTGAARDRYNRISLAVTKILEIWREATGRTDTTLGAALSSAADATEHLRGLLRQSASEELLRRFEQFVEEGEAIIPAAAEAVRKADATALGELVARSQAGAEKLLGNQVPETIALAESARKLGAIAASAFGAGFGGSVWALARTAEAQQFRDAWANEYRQRFPAAARDSEFFVTAAGPGVVHI